jgi:signal transduction histidine kinase
VRRNVLSIGLEALHNAVRHAGATRVGLVLRPRERGWELVIEDDGAGIRGEPENGNNAAPGSGDRARLGTARNGGRGLAGMRRRAAELGADLAVHSAATGTRIALRFPLAGREAGRRRFSLRTLT